MSETTNAPVFSPPTADWIPGGRLVGDLLPDSEETKLQMIIDQLMDEGVELGRDRGWIRRQFADPAMLNGLGEAEQRTGIPAAEFVKHSMWFSRLDRTSIMHGYREIPQSADNVHQDGRPRRHEEGAVIDLDLVRAQGIDPAKVLYYRVTQPNETPKPEYYWTSDSVEVRGGLGVELGGQALSAIVMASTLETIDQNGGLIEDMNDDEGIAVRQINLGPFEQSQALFTFHREREG